MHKENQTVPYWEKLLLAWEQYGGAGLTLPFLAGARTLVDRDFNPSIENAESLLQEIFATGIEGRTICINWSAMTKAYGICLITGETTDGIYLSTPASIFSIDLA